MTGNMDVKDLRADDLRYLAAVANTGRLTAAAQALGVDHTTVSRRLRALEKVLRARLLHRGQDGWELTATGRAVVEHARTIQDAVDRAAQAAAGTQLDSLVGTVRVTAADGFGTLFVVPALARVRARHPCLNIELVTGARELTLRDAFDLGITPGRPPITRLFTERLCDYDSGFYASEAYLAEHGDPVSLPELRHHTMIYFVDRLERVREIDLASYLPEGAVRFSSTNIFAQVEATRRGVGVALLSKFMAGTADDIRRVALKIVLPRVPVTLAARRDAIARPEVAVVREALHEEVRSRRDELIWNASRSR